MYFLQIKYIISVMHLALLSHKSNAQYSQLIKINTFITNLTRIQSVYDSKSWFKLWFSANTRQYRLSLLRITIHKYGNNFEVSQD